MFLVLACHQALFPASTDVLITGAVSVDHSVVPFQRFSSESEPVFLSVKPGMTVICGNTESDDWWMADLIHVDGGARNPLVPTLFQVADVDTGTVRWVCADLVTHIVPGC